MFLIVAKWQDGSDSIFLVGKDPENKKLPAWEEIFTKLDTIADPAAAMIQYARVSREFVLLRDEETLEFSLDDPIACSRLQPLKLTQNMPAQWYEKLLESSQQSVDEEAAGGETFGGEPFNVDDEPEF